MSNGWPLGLDSMNLRLRVVESIQAAASEPGRPHCARSDSFSSFTSSDLDTESTKSFFQEGSVSLGRIIRIRPGDGDGLYFTVNSFHYRENQQLSARNGPTDSFRSHDGTVSGGLCIPLFMKCLCKDQSK